MGSLVRQGDPGLPKELFFSSPIATPTTHSVQKPLRETDSPQTGLFGDTRFKHTLEESTVLLAPHSLLWFGAR